MKPCKQAKDFCTSINGRAIPKHALYGNVSGIYWYSVDIPKFQYIFVYKTGGAKSAPHWERVAITRYPEIGVFVRKFTKSADFVRAQIEYCAHKREESRAMFYAAKREESRRAAIARKQAREDMSGAPYRKRADYSFSGGRDNTARENAVWRAAEIVRDANPAPMPEYSGTAAVFHSFEMGQTTAGTAGQYTRSGFETRDGIKVRFADYEKLYGKVREGKPYKNPENGELVPCRCYTTKEAKQMK